MSHARTASITLAALVCTSAVTMAQEPTFYKDVLPILQKNCQSCHRPGQIAPFSMLSYESTRPWARSIKTKVESRQIVANFRQGNDWVVESGLKPGERIADDSRNDRDRNSLLEVARCFASDNHQRGATHRLEQRLETVRRHDRNFRCAIRGPEAGEGSPGRPGPCSPRRFGRQGAP